SALIYAMGTLSTSGIRGQDLLGAGASPVIAEMLVFVFLLFALSHRALKGLGLGRTGPLTRDPELRLAAGILVSVTAILLLRHAFATNETGNPASLSGLFAAAWGALFTSASFLTTTGFVSSFWPQATDWFGLGTPGLLLLGLALFGGGVATTAGGVKLLRIYTLLRQGERELERIIHPNSIGSGGVEARRLRRDGALLAWVFFVLFAVTIAITMAVLLLLGQEFEPALVLGIGALTTTGPLASTATASSVSYADLPELVKVTLGYAMIVGRLETLALIALFLPLVRQSD
nr:potassium transporter TrkG [Tabrizicola sp.]